jgi:hypothetical protein
MCNLNLGTLSRVCKEKRYISHLALDQALSTTQSIETFLCAINKLIDLRFDLVCEIRFISANGSLVNQKEYLQCK